MALFENYEGRMPQLQPVLDKYGFKNFEEVKAFTNGKGVDAYSIVESTQPICFENVKWAYELGAAIAMKEGAKNAAEAAKWIGVGLQAFCIPGSVADQRQVGIGHGNLGAMLLDEETECFAFLAGHESFAAAEGAIKIALNANKVRKKPLRVILNGLGKDAAMIISRINGFTYVQTKYDYREGRPRPHHREQDRLLRRPPGQGELLRRGRRARGRGHHVARGRGRIHHRQLHQPHPLPASRGGHL